MNLELGVDNRGLAYGDGLFETCRVRRAVVPWLDRHLARLRRGAEVLRLDWRSIESGLHEELADLLAQSPDVDWVKLIVTRVADGRGYAPSTSAACRYWQTGTLAHATDHVSIARCVEVSAENPTLAGLKHLNRLPEVLATGGPEVREERLLVDPQGRLISATSANVFLVIGEEIVTPTNSRRGVEGVMAAWVCEQVPVQSRGIAKGLVSLASECFLTNALRGIVSVDRIGDQRFALDTPVANALRSQLSSSSWA
ncbi:MAG: aminotransferase class IV [Pseudomonadota bacterium]